MKLELTQEEINQLLAFLNRTTLQPPEINTFVRLIQKIQQQNFNKPERKKK
ncbi:MAG: hypothetical protein ACTSUF_03615 [Candidatus Heimdallarchaeaceae archaeon]